MKPEQPEREQAIHTQNEMKMLVNSSEGRSGGEGVSAARHGLLHRGSFVPGAYERKFGVYSKVFA